MLTAMTLAEIRALAALKTAAVMASLMFIAIQAAV